MALTPLFREESLSPAHYKYCNGCRKCVRACTYFVWFMSLCDECIKYIAFTPVRCYYEYQHELHSTIVYDDQSILPIHQVNPKEAGFIKKKL